MNLLWWQYFQDESCLQFKLIWNYAAQTRLKSSYLSHLFRKDLTRTLEENTGPLRQPAWEGTHSTLPPSPQQQCSGAELPHLCLLSSWASSCLFPFLISAWLLLILLRVLSSLSPWIPSFPTHAFPTSHLSLIGHAHATSLEIFLSVTFFTKWCFNKAKEREGLIVWTVEKQRGHRAREVSVLWLQLNYVQQMRRGFTLANVEINLHDVPWVLLPPDSQKTPHCYQPWKRLWQRGSLWEDNDSRVCTEGLMKGRLLHTEDVPREIRDGKLGSTLRMSCPPSSATSTCDKTSPPSNVPQVRLFRAAIFSHVSSLVLIFAFSSLNTVFVYLFIL